MSDQEYQEYVEQQKKLYDVEEDSPDLRKTTAQLQMAYDQSVKDYQQLKQDLVYKDAVIRDLTKKLEENEKTLNDVIIHAETKKEAMRNLRIEIPHKLLYNLAMDWSSKSDSIFVICDRDTGEVCLKTTDEMIMPPTYRHWWLSQKPIEGVN